MTSQTTSPDLIRWGALGALLAATGWTASGIVAFVFGVAPFGPVGSLSWYLIESFDTTAEVGMMLLLVGLHVRQAPDYGWLGAAGFVVAFVGTAGIARRLIQYFSAPPQPARTPRSIFPELTDREREILDLIAAGKNNQEIARSLFLSVKTVQNYVSDIFTKLQVADRAQAIVRAREAGLGQDEG